ncbi:MAG: hypothetical protein IPI93_12760 [Sphingobacteriaceae bacterium]|nr:hypothetical protein [Sphingobacteriaceae bacterium]
MLGYSFVKYSYSTDNSKAVLIVIQPPVTAVVYLPFTQEAATDLQIVLAFMANLDMVWHMAT